MEDGIIGNDIEQGNPNSILDGSLYNTRHERNRIFIQVNKSETLYHQNPNPNPNPIPISVKIIFNLTHQIVPDDLPRIVQYHGLFVDHAIDQFFTQPLTVFHSYEQARPAFENMLSRFQIPFEFRAEFGEVHWGYGFYHENDPLQGVDGVVDRITKAGVTLVRQALNEGGALQSVSIKVRVLKRTVIDAQRFRDLGGVGQAEVKVHGGRKRLTEVVKNIKTTSFNGFKPLESSICLNRVEVGAHISSLPCSHAFHKHCMVSWLKKRLTCPLCRLQLVEPAPLLTLDYFFEHIFNKILYICAAVCFTVLVIVLIIYCITEL